MTTFSACPEPPYVDIEKLNLEEREGYLSAPPPPPEKQPQWKSKCKWFVGKARTVCKRKNGTRLADNEEEEEEEEEEETGIQCSVCWPHFQKISPTESVPLKSVSSQNDENRVVENPAPAKTETAQQTREGEVPLSDRGVKVSDDSKLLETASGQQSTNSEEKKGLLLDDDSSLEDILLCSTNEPFTKEQEEQHGGNGKAKPAGFAPQNGDPAEEQLTESVAKPTSVNKKGDSRERIVNKIKKTIEAIQKKLSKGTASPPRAPSNGIHGEEFKDTMEAEMPDEVTTIGESTMGGSIKLEETPEENVTVTDEGAEPKTQAIQPKMETETAGSKPSEVEAGHIAKTPIKEEVVGLLEESAKSNNKLKEKAAKEEKAAGESEAKMKPRIENEPSESKEFSKEPNVPIEVMETTPQRDEKPQDTYRDKVTRCLKNGAATLKNGAGTVKRELKKAIVFIKSPIKRFSRCLKARREPTEKSSIEPLLLLERDTQAQESVSDRSRLHEREIWSSVSRTQLKAVYATIAASVARSPKEKLIWLGTLHRILAHKASRHDVNDRVRKAAIDGKVILVCLKTLEEGTETAKAKLTKKESTMESPLVQPDDDNLTTIAIQVLQESTLNDAGVVLFKAAEGPQYVVDRLKTWKTLQTEIHPKEEEEKELKAEQEEKEDKGEKEETEEEEEEGEEEEEKEKNVEKEKEEKEEKVEKETEEKEEKVEKEEKREKEEKVEKEKEEKVEKEEKGEKEKIVDSRWKGNRAMDALKGVYGLLFATSGLVSDCSDKWAKAGILEFPKLTLRIVDPQSPFVSNSNYVGLALGTLRVLASRELLPEEEVPGLVDSAIEKLVANSTNSWISENALAFLALTMMRHPTIVDYIDSREGINIWKIIVEICEASQSEGHVLYQGLLSLEEACHVNPGKIVPRVAEAGALKLVESILPVQENKYVEHLITTAIKLKQLMSPYDFEKEELQSYIRSKNYHQEQQFISDILPMMETDNSKEMIVGDAKLGEEEGKAEKREVQGPHTSIAEDVENYTAGDADNKNFPIRPAQLPEESLENKGTLKEDFDG